MPDPCNFSRESEGNVMSGHVKVSEKNILDPPLNLPPQQKLMGFILSRDQSTIQVLGKFVPWFLCKSAKKNSQQNKQIKNWHGRKHNLLGEWIKITI